MKTVLVRYTTHAASVAENEELIRAVFDELRASAPAGLNYRSFRESDGSTFVHVATIDTADGSNPLLSLPSFRKFQENFGERCAEPPSAMELQLVDAYAAP